MSSSSNGSESPPENARYEYRVWGKHREARKKLAEMASAEVVEEIEDCYLLVEDDAWNAKVRDSRLKVKQRISAKRGFEQWDSQYHKTAEEAPSPFDEVFETLRLDRPQRGKQFDLSKAIRKLDESHDARAVFVTKRRKRFRVGDITAETTKIDLQDGSEVLHSIAIQGNSVKALKSLLRELGLDELPNVPMHVVIENETNEA